MASRATRILLTGFGAFPGAHTNPTVEIVRAISRSPRLARLGIAIEGRVLPVVFSEIGAVLAQALEQTQPGAVVHLGLAGRRKVLSVETRALNRVGTLRADAARRFAHEGVAVAGGATILRSRWPSQRLLAAMNHAGATTRASIDAGDYLCNLALYRTLATTRLPAGFIHVPRPRGRGRRAQPGRPTLAQMIRAVEAALIVLARESRRATP